MRIAITSQSGSRNRGCEALVQSILIGLKTQPQTKDAEIELHTGDRVFDSWRFGPHVKYVTATCLKLPKFFHTPYWELNRVLYQGAALAEKILLGLQSSKSDFSTCMESALILMTGGDNLSVDYGSFYNNAAYMNLGRPTFLCALSIGPFPKREEEYFKKSTKNVCLITARESQTFKYMKELNLACPVEQTADVAFLLPFMKREETLDYGRRFLNVDLENKKLAGLSVSELITRYYKYGREEGIKQIAQFVDYLNGQGYAVVLIPHVMERNLSNDDLVICTDILRRTKESDANIALSGWFSSIEAKSIVALCDVLIGARTHATIASMSQGIPTVAIAYSRKAYGIMEDYYGESVSKQLIVPADQVFAERLIEATKVALQIGRQNGAAERMKKLALRNFELLANVIKANGIA